MNHYAPPKLKQAQFMEEDSPSSIKARLKQLQNNIKIIQHSLDKNKLYRKDVR